MVSRRVAKVQELAREILGESIQRLKDPRIGFATITAVRMTPDLRQARIYVSVLGTQDEQAETMRGLESATPHLRSELGRQVRLRYSPELLFEFDRSAETAERIDELLSRVRVKHREEPSP